MRGGWVRQLRDPVVQRRVHGWATVMWMALVVPSVAWWRNSVTWVVLMSCYACITGHWASWQAASVEVKQDNGTAREEGE